MMYNESYVMYNEKGESEKLIYVKGSCALADGIRNFIDIHAAGAGVKDVLVETSLTIDLGWRPPIRMVT